MGRWVPTNNNYLFSSMSSFVATATTVLFLVSFSKIRRLIVCLFAYLFLAATTRIAKSNLQYVEYIRR